MLGLETPPAGEAARSCPRLGASHGRKSRTGVGRCCQHGNSGLGHCAGETHGAFGISSHLGWVRESWVGSGVQGKPRPADTRGFSLCGRLAQEKCDGLGGLGQGEERDSGTDPRQRC